MGYIHNIAAVVMADDIARRRKTVLSKLQQEFYDLVAKDMVDEIGPDELEDLLEDLKKDIKTMNAAELRHNIKVWRDSE